MYLTIDSFGAKLKVKNGIFVVEDGETKKEYSPLAINSILLGEHANLTTAAIKTATEHHIEIIIADFAGRPFAIVWSPKSVNVRARKEQLAYDDCGLAKSIIRCKMNNQYYFLKSLWKTRKILLDENIEKISTLCREIDNVNGKLVDVRNHLIGIEGMASNYYFAAINKIMPALYKFEGRSRQPPKDKFNAMLSYGYSILYGEVEKNCIVSGLDPYVGFLHSDRYNRISLVLDVIELFRQPIVDRAVVTLISQKRINETDYQEIENGLYLSHDGKKKVIGAIVERLETKVTYHERKIKFRQIIFEICHDLIEFFIEKKEFSGFVYRWQ